jgi:hypothetical protein
MKFVARPIQIRADVICTRGQQKVCPKTLFRAYDSPLLYHFRPSSEAQATVIESTDVTGIHENPDLQLS